MADPIIKIKRSAVAGKIPSTSDLNLGELALNTYDGHLYTTKNVGVGNTVVVVNAFRVGSGTDVYDAYFTQGNVGIGTEFPDGSVHSSNNAVLNVGVVTANYLYGDGSNLTGIAGGATVSISPPSTPSNGDLWYDPGDGRTYIYYTDSGSSQWVDASPVVTGIVTANITTDNLVVTGVSTLSQVNVTYIDSVGIITARNGITVATGTATTALIVNGDVDFNGNVDIDGHTELDYINVSAASTFAGLVDINAGGQADTFKVEDLTSGRVVLAGTGGEIEDSVNLTFDGSTLVLTGDQTISGTVDGRDVAADGTKLDGIESNATADQTAAEIRTLVGSATNSNVFTDADHTKLDGIETGATADQTKSDIDALGIDADQLDGQEGSYYTGYTDTAIANLIDSSPSTLDTLNELAAALGDDANFSTTITNSIATKLSKSGGQMIGNITFSGSQTVDGRDVSADGTKLDGIESGATADQTAAEIRTLVGSASDSNVFTDADHSKLDGIESGATGDQTAAEIRTLVGSASDSNVFTDADHTKLDGIESGATADQTASEIRTLVESASDSNVFTDTDHSKLDGIEASATADQTAAEIRTLVESATDSNVFTDADHTKLDGIESNATADQTAAEILTAIKTVDGSGSGLDADLLDGKHKPLNWGNDTYSGSAYTANVNADNYRVVGSSVFMSSSSNTPNNNGHLWTVAGGDTANRGIQMFSNNDNTGKMWFRCLNGKTWHNIWTSGNDGSGSGLDADTVDGIQGASFLRSDATDTATGFIHLDGGFSAQKPSTSWTNNYFGVGTLGQLYTAGSYWTSLVSNGYRNSSGTWTSHNAAALTGAAEIDLTPDGNIYFRTDATKANGSSTTPTLRAQINSSGVFSVGGNTVWHAGNDGSGSGLDADTVDGIQASSFLRSDANDTTNSKITFGPNPGWGKYLTIGGNANNSDANSASVGVTNGNLHIDAVAGGYATLLNFYDGTGGVAFGSGASGAVAWMGPDGDLWKGGSDNSGSKYWHAANDGSGSGLDADTLDGQQGSFYQSATNLTSGTIPDARIPDVITPITLVQTQEIRGNGTQLVLNAGEAAGKFASQTAEKIYLNAESGTRVSTPEGGANFESGYVSRFTEITGKGIYFRAPDGTTRIGEITSTDTTWLRINEDTAKNIYTPRYIRADGGFFVDGTSKGINGSGNFIGGTIAGASDYGTLLRSNADDTMTGALTIDVDNKANGALRITANQTNPENDFYFAQEIISTLSGSTATTSDREQGGIYMDINSTATGGDTSNEHRAYGIYIDLDSTGDTDNVYGIYADATVTPTTGTTSEVTGLYGRAEDNGGAGAVSYVYGVRGEAYSDNSTSDIDNMYGGYFRSSCASDSGVINGATGVSAEIEIPSGTGDIFGDSYVVRAVFDNNGTVAQTNNTYLFHGDYQGTLPTNAYGVYIADNVQSYFAGNVTSNTTVQGNTLKSTVATGTAPLTVTSTTKVTNLNADLLDGVNSGSFLRSDANDTFTGELTITGNLLLSDQVRIGDDAWIEDFNVANTIRIKGNQDNNQGYIAFGQRTEKLGCNNSATLTYNGSEVWHAGNDGSGSGLDADTVDGLQASSFLRSDANDTLSAIITGHASNTEVLRVRSSSYSSNYLYIGGWSGTNSNDIARIRSSSNLHIDSPADGSLYLNWYASNRTIKLGNTGQLVQAAGSNTVWHAGNDGSGSGLDADLLDGVNSGSFLRSDANDSASGEITFNGRVNIRGHIDLSDNEYLYFGSGDDVEFFCNGSHMYMDLNSGIGNFYIRDGSTTRFTFDDAGHFTATGNINSSSDVSLKDNITTIPNALDKVLKMRGVEYDRNDMNGQHQIGVIAQEIEEVVPEIVSQDENTGLKSVSYGNITAILIEAIKEQQKEINKLKLQNKLKKL